MPELLVSLMMLGFPLVAFATFASLVYRAKGDVEGKPDVLQGGTIIKGAIPIVLALPLTPTVFGLVLWLQILYLESDPAILSGEVPPVLRWVGITVASTAALAIGAEAVIALGRAGELVRQPTFGRVLILLVVQEIAVVFHLTLSLAVLSRLTEPSTLLPQQANGLITALQGFAVSTLALPLGAVLSARVQELPTPRGFSRALALSEVGTLPVIGGLVWALQRVASV